jgi:hypothetical protein
MILNKKNIYLITIITCLGLAAFGFLVVTPCVQEIFSLSNNIKDQKASISDFDLKEENFKKLKEDEQEADSTLNNLSEALISKENSLEFIVLLEEIANKTSNTQTIEVVNKEDETTAKVKKEDKEDPEKESFKDPLEGVEALYFKVKLQGSYKSLLLYLAELESMRVYTDIVSTEIKSGNAGPASGNKPFEEELPTDIIRTTLEIRTFTR